MDKIVKAAKVDNQTNPVAGAVEKKAAPKFIGKAPLAPVTHKMTYPMEFDGVEYHEVKIGHLIGDDFTRLKMLTAMGTDNEIAMIHLMTRTPVEVLKAMHADDFTALATAAEAFIPARFLEEASEQDSTIGQNSPESSPISSVSA